MEEKAKNHKRIYSFLIMTLIICIILSVFLSVDSGAAVQDEESAAQPEASTSSNMTSTPPNLPAEADASDNSSLLTEEQALQIAMPLIEEYVRENNRTIATVKTHFSLSVRDFAGSRGGPSLSSLLQNFSTSELQNYPWPTYPSWSVEAVFDPYLATPLGPDGKMPSDPQYYIIGYCVLIWADNGQIRTTNEQGKM